MGGTGNVPHVGPPVRDGVNVNYSDIRPLNYSDRHNFLWGIPNQVNELQGHVRQGGPVRTADETDAAGFKGWVSLILRDKKDLFDRAEENFIW